jgi:hypothetical protein
MKDARTIVRSASMRVQVMFDYSEKLLGQLYSSSTHTPTLLILVRICSEGALAQLNGLGGSSDTSKLVRYVGNCA